nr:hypothetical protein [Tanacetum cinerariifolium]
SGISNLLAVGTTFTGSGNLYCQWKLSSGSENALCILFPTLDTISTTESDEFIKSCVENLVPNQSESEDKNGCDLPACFTTFLNIFFDAEYEFESVDNQSLSNEDCLKEIFSNPLFEEEINSMRIDQHNFNAKLLYDNSSPRLPEELVSENSYAEIESFSPSPIPIEDSDYL